MGEGWPAWATQKVEIAEPDPVWQQQAADLAGDLDQRPWRRMHVLPGGARRLAHLHLVEPTHPQWREALMLRDRLRQRPELAVEYARIKRLAAKEHEDDREAYTEAKSTFVRTVIHDLR